MKRNLFTMLLLCTAVLAGCSKNDEAVDSEYPVIDITGADAFPVQCSVLERGKTVTFKARFTDNVALGSYSLDIHHNFDHHTHSTEVNTCAESPNKTPVKPLVFIKDYTLPAGGRDYTATATISIPADVDTGDYHFMIRLTDKEGWQTIKGLSIKIQ